MAGVADEFLLQEMLLRTRHRGPDDWGIYITPLQGSGEKVALGNNRLSIMDLSAAGHQPMSNERGTVWVAYNGEIYNFVELRRELEADGHRFISHSDTEVLPYLYEKYGPDMVKKLNGMFAFALWDSIRERLFVFRDRMGIKPLYYAKVGERLYFASEIKALLACPEVQPQLDPQALTEYLTFLYVPNPRTMFKGIYKLPPGHSLIWEKGNLKVEPYWDLEFGPYFTESEDELCERFRHLLMDATRRQLISDVPVGFFLSGGLDSSTLVACAAALNLSTLRCYSIAFQSQHGALEQSDEDPRYARLVADRFGAKFEELVVEPEVASLLPKIVWHLDEPVADPAAIATYLICKAAKPDVTVLLSGQGADEVLGGYRVHLVNSLGPYLAQIPRTFRDMLSRRVLPSLTNHRSALPGVRSGLVLAFCRFSQKLLQASNMPLVTQYALLRSYFSASRVRNLLSDRVIDELGGFDPQDSFKQHFIRKSQDDNLNQMLYVDSKTFLPDLNLTYSDKLSMACSIETRVPFLDGEVVDFLLRVPPSLKIHRMTQKFLLRKALRGKLPQSVLRRRKAAFGLPVRSWLQKELRGMLQDLLSEGRLAKRGLLCPSQVLKMVQENESGQHDHTLRLWALLTLEVWSEVFLDSLSTAATIDRSGWDVHRTTGKSPIPPAVPRAV